MKCPSCGAWNRASLPVCQKCGEPLAALPQGKESWRDALRDDQTGSAYYRMDEDGESSATPDSRDSLAREMAELKKRKADGELMQRKLRQTIAQRVETQAAPEVSTAPEEDAVPEDGSAEADGPASAAPQDGGEPPASAQRRPPRRMDGSRTTVRYAGAPGSHLRELYQTEEPLDNSRNYDLLWAEQAAYAARYELVMMEIIRREGIVVTEADVEPEYQELTVRTASGSVTADRALGFQVVRVTTVSGDIRDIRNLSYELVEGDSVRSAGTAEAIKVGGKWYIRGVAQSALTF